MFISRCIILLVSQRNTMKLVVLDLCFRSLGGVSVLLSSIGCMFVREASAVSCMRADSVANRTDLIF